MTIELIYVVRQIEITGTNIHCYYMFTDGTIHSSQTLFSA